MWGAIIAAGMQLLGSMGNKNQTQADASQDGLDSNLSAQRSREAKAAMDNESSLQQQEPNYALGLTNDEVR